MIRRLARYSGVSLIAFLLAQLGLAVAYGLGHWPVLAAVLFSLVVSAVPAYLLSRWFVWSDRGAGRVEAREGSWFLLVALAGSLLTVGVVTAAESLARNHTTDHATLTLVVNLSSVAATILVWLARFAVLDRLVFRRRDPAEGPPTLTPKPGGAR